jgi:hypothetical protein
MLYGSPRRITIDEEAHHESGHGRRFGTANDPTHAMLALGV